MLERFLVAEFADQVDPIPAWTALHPQATLDIAMAPVASVGPPGQPRRHRFVLYARGVTAMEATELETAIGIQSDGIVTVRPGVGQLLVRASFELDSVQGAAARALVALDPSFEQRWVRIHQGVCYLFAGVKPGEADSLLAEVRQAIAGAGVDAQVELVEGPPPEQQVWPTLHAALSHNDADLESAVRQAVRETSRR